MKKSLLLCLLFFLGVIASCGKHIVDGPDPEPPAEPVDSTQTDTTSAPEWVNGYPVGVQVDSFVWNVGGKRCSGYIATIDFKQNRKLGFNCVKAYPNGTKKTTSAQFQYFAKQNKDKTPVLAFNAGYFGGTTSVSPIFSKGKVVCIAWREFNWPSDEVYKNPLFTPRACLGQMDDGHFEMQWVYCTNKFMQTHCAYPDISLLGNNEKTETFRADPPTDTTAGAYQWMPYEGVGAGPMLVRDSVNIAESSYWYECLNAGGTSGLSYVNRTAAGLTSDGKLILIVCDGRGANNSAGITLPALADKFLAMGCVSAMNFDGGGSSTIVGPDGKVMNHPSDQSGERAVVSCIIISENQGDSMWVR